MYIFFTELFLVRYTDKKLKSNFPIYKKIQNGAVAKSYMTNGLLIFENMWFRGIFGLKYIRHAFTISISTSQYPVKAFCDLKKYLALLRYI
jgi:hypothetical protein